MEIDYPHDDSVDIPKALKDHVIYKCRAYNNAKQYSQLIVTGGPNAAFYETQQTNILCSCNISRLKCFKDTILPRNNNENQRSPLHISLNIYFSYRKKQKEIFYFLQINDVLVVLGKDCQRLIVHCEYSQIKSYRCVDETNEGDMCVEIIYTDDASEEFQLSAMGYHKAIESRYASDSSNRFARLTQALEENVATINSTLATTNSTIQKAMHEFKTNCQRIGNDGNEESSILAQYGDIWMKNINGKLLIGIPVYNCSSR